MSETGPQNQPDEAMVDLLIKQVTEGLSAAEQRELDVLDSAVASAYLRDFERAAAAISLATAAADELPPALRALLEQQSEQHFAESRIAATAATAPGIAQPVAATPAAGTQVLDFKAQRAPQTARPARSSPGAWGWLAAAACLVLAVVGWLRPPPVVAPPQARVDLTVPPPVVVPHEPAPPTPAEERAALLARSDSLKVTLAPTKDPAAAGVSGDVVWDPATQKGFLHFTGLAANDPATQQYQIWIFDGGRDKRYPVDGGVFDVPADSPDVIIPIRAGLAIHDAKAFAVTVEKPGGVVVSALGHVVALGKAG